MAEISAALGIRTRPTRRHRLTSFAEFSCQKIVSDLQLAVLRVENINWSSLTVPSTAPLGGFEDTHRTMQRIASSGLDESKLSRRTIASHRHIERCVILLKYPFNVWPYATGAFW